MSDRLEQGELVVGRYRVLSTLGAGGMADVYLAEDLKLGRKVALKVLLHRYAGDAQFVERFRREAQAAAQINHPNIVGIHDWGAIGETYYIVMEYVEGETLKDRIRRSGRLSPSAAVTIALGLLGAVETAHRAGVVHRDIKSQNILLDQAGTVKVTDFGIAKAGDSEMTEAGSILGTAQYLAPEQAKGLPVDERSDLYSVGVVLYEMLTGKVPFQGDSAVTVALKHVNELAPEPSTIVPDLPYALNQIVLKALAKDPDRRYQNAGEFVTDLKSARSGGPLLAAAYDASDERTQLAAPLALRGEEATRVMAAPRRTGAPASPARRKRRVWPWILLALFVVAAAFAAALAWGAFGDDGVTVPSVVNLSEAKARAQLEAAGFTVKAHDDYSDDVQTGFVIRQDPEGDAKAGAGDTVDIWVCRGALNITLIDFRNMKPDEVATWLDQNGLKGDARDGANSSVAKGRVYKQEPLALAKVPRGGTVIYWVSQGKPQVPAPDVTGMPLNDATKAIQDAGFKLGLVSERADAIVPDGSVIEQNPGAGTMVEKGATIDLVVSLGPSPSPSASPSLVEVPDVVTLLQADAEAALTAAGFLVKPKQKPSIQPPGTVFEQDPLAGTMSPAGSQVVIWVAK